MSITISSEEIAYTLSLIGVFGFIYAALKTNINIRKRTALTVISLFMLFTGITTIIARFILSNTSDVSVPFILLIALLAAAATSLGIVALINIVAKKQENKFAG